MAIWKVVFGVTTENSAKKLNKKKIHPKTHPFPLNHGVTPHPLPGEQGGLGILWTRTCVVCAVWIRHQPSLSLHTSAISFNPDFLVIFLIFKTM